MVEIRRLYVFLALFTFVYFLESIGGTYMVTAVQNIERHFQIPSKLSGFLVSAHDISYVLTVILVSYYGSRGNRAKWIGFGTILMAIAHIFTASPNFLFPSNPPQLNLTDVEIRLRPGPSLLSSANHSNQLEQMRAFLDFIPLRDRLPHRIREMLLNWLDHPDWLDTAAPTAKPLPRSAKNRTGKSLYALDEPLIAQILWYSDLLFVTSNSTQRRNVANTLRDSIQEFVTNRQEFQEADLKTMRRAAIAPFAFCYRLVNQFRSMLQHIKCDYHHKSNFGPLMIIFGAMLLLGLGRTMPWSLGIPLIDDNVKKQEMPMYFAMINFFKILGPICGFLIGSIVNKLYYQFPSNPPKGLTPHDPTWIGAWWLGFLFIGFVMIGPSLILFFFPEGKKGRKTHKQRIAAHQNGGGHHRHTCNGKVADLHSMEIPTQNNEVNSHNNGIAVIQERKKLTLFDRHVEKESKDGLKAFLHSYHDVLNSKVYIGASVARVLDVLAFKGYMVFLPKYLENHYGIPQYRVHIYMAFFGVLGFALGTASGGLITRKLRLNGRKAALFVLAISIFNTSLFMLKSTLGCHSIVNSIGRDLGYEYAAATSQSNFTRECNSQCGCEAAKLYPVCDHTGQAYYSPCHAGCRHVEVIDLDTYQLEFSECDCVSGIVSKDFCKDDCTFMKYAFFCTVVIGAFVAGTGVVPGMLLLLRAVPPQTRSPALGLQGFLVSLIGTLPSPILWGWLIDSACQVWDYDCQHKGACQIYDPSSLRIRMHWLYVFIRLFSLVADIYVWKHAEGLNLQEEENPNLREQSEKATAQEAITLEVIPQ